MGSSSGSKAHTQARREGGAGKPVRTVDHLRRSRIAFAVAVICGLFVTETMSAHRVQPSPASPYIWAVLGSMGVGALVYAGWCRLKLRAARQDPPAGPPSSHTETKSPS